MTDIKRVLIANRGEIACRIIASCRRLGISTVAIYSQIDRHAQHVIRADTAYLIDGATPVAAYLNQAAIIAIAQQAGCDAIHPGYGFLSENSDFAAACAAAKVIFIGPPASAIAAMGSKSAAKTIMEQAGVPLIPGYHGSEQTLTQLQTHADAIGYPLLIKAALGGGGKGMRVVNSAAEFASQLSAAKREASASFADEQMLLEKYFIAPRHIEVQIFADQHGSCIYLGDRDCSLQRRHQKVIEEAPAPGLSSATRQSMGQAAVAAAKAINYQGAGTIEFLLDEQHNFYFMEMNTRLQVEHPVTEMITQQDLVEWQLRVAAGAPLPLQQQQVTLHGHAVEARIYAEDPQQQFLPASGRLQQLQLPQSPALNTCFATAVRVDTGVQSGDDISSFYDPLIAKLIVYQADRQQALALLEYSLQQSAIVGVKHNLGFLATLVGHHEFASAHISTDFIGQHLPELLQLPNENQLLATAAMVRLLTETTSTPLADGSLPPLNGFRLNKPACWHFYLARLPATETASDHWLTVHRTTPNHYQLQLNNEQYQLAGQLLDANTAQITINGCSERIKFYRESQQLSLLYRGHTIDFALQSTSTADPDDATQTDSDHHFCAPMNGTIVTQLVEVNTPVQQGQGLIVMEAMKMEYQINAPSAGHVRQFRFDTGDLVKEGARLLEFEAANAPTKGAD